MAKYQDIRVDFVDRPKTQVQLSKAYTLTAKMFIDGTQDVVASGTITVRGPGGAALATPVSGAAVTVDGSGTMTYALVAGNTGVLGANYSADWNVTDSNGDTWTFTQLFDVCRHPLRNPVVQADLVRHHPDLTDILFSTESNYQDTIEQAFEDVHRMIEQHGMRPYLVMNSDALQRPIEHWALSKIFLARVKEEGDRWHLLHAYHEREFHSIFQAANLVYDLSESGTADGTSNVDAFSGEQGHRSGFRWEV